MIETSTFSFLKHLASNNDREWFKQNRENYDQAHSNVLEFTGNVIRELSKADPSIPADLNPKSCVMRIYRDIRFSKDKSPYKTNFGIAISANGKNFHGPGYYIHIAPGKSFVAGGSWYPEAEYLKSIRQEIDYNGSEWRQIINHADFKDAFGDLDHESKLQTAPKGYPSDHPDIDYLKLKSFTAARALTDKELSSAGSLKLVTSMFEKLYPFMLFLRNANS